MKKLLKLNLLLLGCCVFLSACGLRMGSYDKMSQGKENIDFISAAEAGLLPEVKSFIASGVDINFQKKVAHSIPGTGSGGGFFDIFNIPARAELIQSDTALMAASRNGHVEVVRYLLDNGADSSIKGGERYGIPLVLATSYGGTRRDKETTEDYIEIVKYILEKGINSVEVKDEALNYAVSGKDFELVKILVESGADVNYIHEEYGNVLLIKSIEGDGKILQYLIEQGADTNARDEYGRSVLMFVAMHNRLELAQYLIAHGADVDLIDNYGNSMLIQAVSGNGDIAMVEYLLAQGADINVRNSRGNLLDFATIRGDWKLIAFFKNAGAQYSQGQAVKYESSVSKTKRDLLKNIEQAKAYGKDVAAVVNSAEMIKLFVEASALGDREIVSYLVESGVKIDSRVDEKKTALMHAAENGHFEMVKYLIANGANPRLKSSAGSTAYDYTTKENIKEYLTDAR